MSHLDKLLNDLAENDLKRQAEEAKRRGVSIEVIQNEEANLEEARRQEQERKDLAEDDKRKIESEKEMTRRIEYGNKIGLGVAAHNGIILNIGGLTERSFGDGQTKATVSHVVLDADYQKGRLVRREGDLLCKPANKLGRRSMGVEGTSSGEPGGALSFTRWDEATVTCKACLQRLQGIQRG